ncbi:AEC family transporter [Allobaculum sp. JKK-2023]|uniref:AEC family transporter n=1 Tax=Allobaculum sp. JKK-2023 TaxID=3108943 RepID=UPI002B05AD07|nr:AEC family transporter [Allobaculum sp. JKK-2023]
MSSVLIKICGYLVIIALGYLLRELKLFRKEDAKLLGTLIISVTLPGALIRNSGAIVIGPEFPLLFTFGIIASIVTLAAGFLLAGRKREPRTSAFMLTVSTFNLGAFLLPFVELFFPGTGVGYLCMFDSANSVMGLGVSYALAKAASSPQEPLTLKSVFKTLVHSIPFMTYVFLFVLAACHLRLPDVVLEYAGTIGNANAFLTMFMIGLLIEFRLPKQEIKEIIQVCLTRWIVVACLGICVFILPDVDPLLKTITILCLFAPVAAAAVPYSISCGYQGDLVGMVSTITMAFSVVSILLIVSFAAHLGLTVL